MKRFFVILLAVLTVVSILSSCSGEVGPGSGSSATPTIEEEMKSESKNAMPLFGTVNSIDEVEFVTGKGLSESEDREITADENGIKSTYHIVYYDSISEELAAHLNTIPKEQFKIPSIKNKIDTTKNYVVLFRSCYFKGKAKATPAFRKVYILDKSSLSENTVLLQEVTFSPDFRYDIDNQIEVSSGMPVRYNWANGETEVADSFIEDTTTDLSALIGGISGKWLLVDPNNNPVRSEHVDATYVLKVAKTNAVCFHEFEIGSFTAEHLRVRNYVYNGTDEHDYAFIIVQKYPEGYRHDWAVECYWYDSGKWHYTHQIQTDGDLIPIWYKDVTDTKLSGFFDEFKAIGNITRIYQAYKGLYEYLENNLYESYVVEYNTAHANLRTVIENPRGKQNSSRSSLAGLLKDDTVAYAYVQYNTNTTSRTACIITRQDYTSYIYLPIALVDNRLVINGKYLDTLQSFYYEESTQKYRDISNYDGRSVYYCEYENADMLVSALGTLGTIDKVCYYTGNTGQVKPHINTFIDSQTTYVAIAAQLSSFNSTYLSTSSNATVLRENTYFTRGHSAYDFDYHKEGCTTVELDVFFEQNGNISSIQLRVVTNPDALESDTYATCYKILDDSFLSN